MSLSINLTEALLIGRAIFLVFCFVIAAISFTRWRRAAARDAERVTIHLAAVAERLSQIEAGLAGLDSRLSEVARQLEEPLRATAATAANASSPSYPIAIRLARNGASCEELMESCRLSRQEADLVKRLHGPSKRTSRAQTAAA